MPRYSAQSERQTTVHPVLCWVQYASPLALGQRPARALLHFRDPRNSLLLLLIWLTRSCCSVRPRPSRVKAIVLMVLAGSFLSLSKGRKTLQTHSAGTYGCSLSSPYRYAVPLIV
jgi:hypothetical protein